MIISADRADALRLVSVHVPIQPMADHPSFAAMIQSVKWRAVVLLRATPAGEDLPLRAADVSVEAGREELDDGSVDRFWLCRWAPSALGAILVGGPEDGAALVVQRECVDLLFQLPNFPRGWEDMPAADPVPTVDYFYRLTGFDVELGRRVFTCDKP